MMRIISIAALVLFSLCGTAFAKKPIPASVQKELDNMYNSYSIASSAIGDINSDGIADYAAVIHKKDKDMYAEVVVFWGKPDGKYELFARSKELHLPQRLPEVHIETKKKSLFISTFRNTLSSASGETYQFQFRGNDLFLIGMETVYREPVWEEDVDVEKYEEKISYNLLTGEKNTQEKKNHKTTVKNEKRPQLELLLLKEFGFDQILTLINCQKNKAPN